MALLESIFIGGQWVDSVRRNNTSGAAVTTVADNGSGKAIPDDYTLTISSVAGGTATVTVSTAAPNNPYNGRVVNNVPLDGTLISNIIPGVNIAFAVGAANGNTTLVSVGHYFGSFESFGVNAGVPSTGYRHRVTNNGANSVSDALVSLEPQAIQVAMTGNVFLSMEQTAVGATEKTAGGGSERVMPYVVTVSDTAGAGVNKTCTLSIDGALFGAASIMNVNAGTTSNSTLLKADGTTVYRVVTGPLMGLEFVIASNCVNADEANVLIFAPRYIQIAPDNAGVAGAYGTADVHLTEAGQSEGVITAGDSAYYWVRVLVPPDSNQESNPYPGITSITAIESEGAGWTT